MKKEKKGFSFILDPYPFWAGAAWFARMRNPRRIFPTL